MLQINYSVEKHYFGHLLQGIETTQILVYPRWLVVLASWSFLLFYNMSFLTKFIHHVI